MFASIYWTHLCLVTWYFLNNGSIRILESIPLSMLTRDMVDARLFLKGVDWLEMG